MKTNSIKNLALSILLSSLLIQCTQPVENEVVESDKSYISSMAQTHADIRTGIRDIAAELPTYTDTPTFVNNVFQVIQSTDMHYSKLSREALVSAKDTLIFASSDALMNMYISVLNDDFRLLFNEYSGGEVLSAEQEVVVDSLWNAVVKKDQEATSTFKYLTGLDSTDIALEPLVTR